MKMEENTHLTPDFTSALYSISQITARLNQEDILSNLHYAVKKVFPVDAIGVYVFNDEKTFVERFSLLSGHIQLKKGQGHNLPISESELALIALNNDSYVYENLNTHQGQRYIDKEIAIIAGVRSAATVPIKLGSEIHGSMVFDCYSPYSLKKEFMPFFQQVASNIGIYLENQRTLQQSMDMLKELENYPDQEWLLKKIQGDLKWQITNIALQFEQIHDVYSANSRMQDVFNSLKQDTKKLLQNLKTTTKTNNTKPLTSNQIADEISKQLVKFRKNTGISTRWGMIGTPREIPQAFSQALYHLTQDVLNHFCISCHPKLVKTQLIWHADAIILEIEHDGQAIGEEQTSETDSQSERLRHHTNIANQYGGTLEVHSVPGWGSRLTMTLPTEENKTGRQNYIPSQPSHTERTKVLIFHSALGKKSISSLRMDSGIQTVGQASTPNELIQLMHHTFPDVLFIEAKASEKEISPLLALLQEQETTPPVIIARENELSSDTLNSYNGFIQQYAPSDTEAIIKAIKNAAQGKLATQSEAQSSPLPDKEWDYILEPLTERETEILALISQGLSNQDIADKLMVQESTVRWHSHNILQKLNAKNRTQAARIATEMGIIH